VQALPVNFPKTAKCTPMTLAGLPSAGRNSRPVSQRWRLYQVTWASSLAVAFGAGLAILKTRMLKVITTSRHFGLESSRNSTQRAAFVPQCWLI